MSQTIARIRKGGKHFEVVVDLEKALKFKQEGIDEGFLETDFVFTNAKNGDKASSEDLEKSFGISDINEVAKKIVKEGEVLIDEEHRRKELEQRLKQVVDYLSRNAVNPQTGIPHTPERIETAIKEAGINIKDAPIEQQINEIVQKISKLIPIKIETKKIKVTIPPQYVGHAYGIIKEYKDSEEWKDDGSLEVILNIPSGILIEFYDKLNEVTKGSSITKEIEEE